MAPRFKCCRKEYWKEKANLTWTSNVTKRKKLFDVDYIDDNGEIEPYPIDDVIDTVCEWNYERILDADAHRNDPKDFKDYSEFQDKYDSWKAMEKDWYQKNWTLDIQNMSWVEDTGRQVDFLIKQLQLKGTEKILDLACGFGRHSLEFARRGYDVTGIDITPAYIDYANEQAKKENLNAKFICQDIRTITFDKEFDVVLNMADGAIGYLEDDGENHKIFSVIAKALKNGGKHFMDIMNGSYAQTHFPCKLWDAGEKGLTLSAFEWEKEIL